MQKLLIFISLVLCWAELALGQPQHSGYQISWFDQFDGDSLDLSKWSPQFSTNPTNNSLHAYLPENVTVSNGNLVIVSQNQPFGNLPYRSGQVISTSASRFGRFEVRGNLPTSNGMWPAIWLLPDAPWPSQGEIDIMENRGNQPMLTSSAFHYGTNPPFSHFFVYEEFQIANNSDLTNFHDSFHTYAAEWDPDQIRYYVDGVHYYTVRDEQVQHFLSTGQTSPMRLIINTAIGGTFLPNPDGSTQWPQTFEIDYAYVYDRVGDRELELENTDFETNNGSLSNWSLFGALGYNVSSDNSQAQSGQNSAKLFGQFNGDLNFSGMEQGVSVQGGDSLRLQASALVRSADSIAGTGNQAFLKLDYYDKQYGAYGSANYISSQEIVLADGSTPNDQWIEQELFATVPANAVEARVAIVFRQVNNSGGAVYIDDIEFENFSKSDILVPTSLSVDAGQVQSGSLGDLVVSDDNRLRILAGDFSDDNLPIELTFLSEPSSVANINSMQFELETSANTGNLRLQVLAYNFQANQFEPVANRPLTTTDEPATIFLVSQPAAYLNASHQASFKLQVSAAGPTLFYPWSLSVDQMRWVVER